MTTISPERVSFDRRSLTVLARVFAAALPGEGCALLLGTPGATWTVRQVWPCLNNWPQAAERSRRFSLDPREQLLAQRWGRQRDLAVLGCAHSHPQAAPQPSATDLQLTLPPALMVIGAPRGTDVQCASLEDWSWACWWLPASGPGEPALTALPVAWRMDDNSGATSVVAMPAAHASS